MTKPTPDTESQTIPLPLSIVEELQKYQAQRAAIDHEVSLLLRGFLLAQGEKSETAYIIDLPNRQLVPEPAPARDPKAS